MEGSCILVPNNIFTDNFNEVWLISVGFILFLSHFLFLGHFLHPGHFSENPGRMTCTVFNTNTVLWSRGYQILDRDSVISKSGVPSRLLIFQEKKIIIKWNWLMCDVWFVNLHCKSRNLSKIETGNSCLQNEISECFWYLFILKMWKYLDCVNVVLNILYHPTWKDFLFQKQMSCEKLVSTPDVWWSLNTICKFSNQLSK